MSSFHFKIRDSHIPSVLLFLNLTKNKRKLLDMYEFTFANISTVMDGAWLSSISNFNMFVFFSPFVVAAFTSLSILNAFSPLEHFSLKRIANITPKNSLKEKKKTLNINFHTLQNLWKVSWYNSENQDVKLDRPGFKYHLLSMNIGQVYVSRPQILIFEIA